MNKYQIEGMVHCAKMYVELERSCESLAAIQRNFLSNCPAEVHLLRDGLKEAAEALNVKTETSGNKEYFVYNGVRFFALVD